MTNRIKLVDSCLLKQHVDPLLVLKQFMLCFLLVFELSICTIKWIVVFMIRFNGCFNGYRVSIVIKSFFLLKEPKLVLSLFFM